MPSWILKILALIAAGAPALAAAEPVTIAVMEFRSKGGVSQDQMDALSDMLAKEIEDLGDVRVMGKSDIRAVLNLEEQKQRLTSCDDQACLAELGGALGARWVVVGNVSNFGETILINLKLIDVENVRVAGRTSRSLSGGQEELVSALPSVVTETFAKVADTLDIEIQVPEDETGWFTRSVRRTGRWNVAVFAGGGSFLYASLSTDDTNAQEEGALYSLEDSREGFRVGASGGIGAFDWLEVSLRVGYYDGSGKGYYQDCLEESCPATNYKGELRRNRWALQAALETRFSWPFDFWIEPVAAVSLGFEWFSESTPKSYYPEGYPDFEEIPIDGFGFMLDAGVGADFYLYPRVRVGFLVSYVFRTYGTLRTDGIRTDARLSTHGLSVTFSPAWIF